MCHVLAIVDSTPVARCAVIAVHAVQPSPPRRPMAGHLLPSLSYAILSAARDTAVSQRRSVSLRDAQKLQLWRCNALSSPYPAYATAVPCRRPSDTLVPHHTSSRDLFVSRGEDGACPFARALSLWPAACAEGPPVARHVGPAAPWPRPLLLPRRTAVAGRAAGRRRRPRAAAAAPVPPA